MQEVDLEALDFSKDSDIKEILLEEIKYSCFTELNDEDLECLNAAGEVWLKNPENSI